MSTNAHGDPVEELKPDSAIHEGNPGLRKTALEFFEYYLSRWRKAALTV